MKQKTLLIFLLLLMLPFYSCSYFFSSRARSENAYGKNREKKEKETQKAYDNAVKRHRKMQTPETRKRMKQSEKKAKRVRENKPEPFYQRWINNRNKKKLNKDSKS